MLTHYAVMANHSCKNCVVYMEKLSGERIEQIYSSEGQPPTTAEIKTIARMALYSQSDNQQSCYVTVSRELTAKQIRAIQLKTEIGVHITSSWSGSYDLFQELWAVALAASDQASSY